MGVNPHELHCRGSLSSRQGLLGDAAGQAEAELGVGYTGLQVFMSVGFDPGRDSYENPGWRKPLADDGLNAVDLVKGVDDYPPDFGAEPRVQLCHRFIVAMEHQALGGHPGCERDVNLAPGRNVEMHAFLVCELRHRLAQKRLGSVGNSVWKRSHCFPASGSHVIFVVDEQRSAILFSQRQQVATGHRKTPSLRDGGIIGEERTRKRGHMRSGTSMPRSSSNSVSKPRVTSTRRSHDACRPASSSRRMWHAS